VSRVCVRWGWVGLEGSIYLLAVNNSFRDGEGTAPGSGRVVRDECWRPLFPGWPVGLVCRLVLARGFAHAFVLGRSTRVV
jgi:hypothetical protein